MAEFARLRPLLAVYLIIVVSAVFLFTEVESIRSFELETPGAISGSCYTSPAAAVDCLAVIPKTGQNTAESAVSPFRVGVPRFLVPSGAYNDITAFFKSPFAGKIQANSFTIKDSILLKLRI
ncbi:MAG: hypothetical protein LBL43_02020 [Treponema sp.]|nr:hypothetical protein [Treponema sp.]